MDGLSNLFDGKYDKALECFEKILKLNPDDGEIWCHKGEALFNLGKYEEALKSFDKSISLNSDLMQPWMVKGMILYNWNRLDEAIKSFDKAIEIGPIEYEDIDDLFRSWYCKGIAFMKLGNDEKALDCYEEALKTNAGDEYMWVDLVAALLELSRPEKALQSLDRAIETHSYHDSGLFMKCLLLDRLKRNKEAVDVLRKAHSHDKDVASSVIRKLATNISRNTIALIKKDKDLAKLIKSLDL